MRRRAWSLAVCVLLSGCMKAQSSTSRALDDVEQGTATTWGKIREALDLSPAPKPKVSKRVQPRYCYRTYEDSICYSKPLEGQESRLVAYQEGNAVGYTIQPRPEPKSKTLPKPDNKTPEAKGEAKPAVASAEEVKPAGPAPQPTTAPASAKPEEPAKAELKTDIKTDQKKLKEITFDPSELEPKKLVPDKME